MGEMAETTDVAVIGAGPDFVIFEKEARLAPSWRRHYDRLHLHTVKRYSSLTETRANLMRSC